MKLTTKTRYALRALIDLVIFSNKERVQIKDISKRQGISESYLENIFTILRQHGILGAYRGKGGGFFLKKPSSLITVLDVAEAIGENIELVKCVQDANVCLRSKVCISRKAWILASKELRKTFSQITLEELIKNEKSNMLLKG